MNLDEYRIWISDLKSKKWSKSTKQEIEKALKFSPERFSVKNGLGKEFISEYHNDRKYLHNKIIESEKIQKLKKRKVEPFNFMYGGKSYSSRVCVCIKTMKNENRRSTGNYKFYENIKYNYGVITNFFSEREIFLFDERGNKLYTTFEAFDEFFQDIREFIIDQLIKK
jgi:hypothetical protein